MRQMPALRAGGRIIAKYPRSVKCGGVGRWVMRRSAHALDVLAGFGVDTNHRAGLNEAGTRSSYPFSHFAGLFWFAAVAPLM